MIICSDGHYEICFEDNLMRCPLCERLTYILRLKEKIEELEGRLNNE